MFQKFNLNFFFQFPLTFPLSLKRLDLIALNHLITSYFFLLSIYSLLLAVAIIFWQMLRIFFHISLTTDCWPLKKSFEMIIEKSIKNLQQKIFIIIPANSYWIFLKLFHLPEKKDLIELTCLRSLFMKSYFAYKKFKW